jgi:dihydroneopterin aldolase
MDERQFDQIRIRDWMFHCRVGVYKAERQAPRPLQVDLTLYLLAAERHDELANTADYAHLQAAVEHDLASSSFSLIESVAERIAAIALADRRVAAVTVCVGKPGALAGARTVEVEITRVRENN